jgi:PAS domain S-box-containing protein
MEKKILELKEQAPKDKLTNKSLLIAEDFNASVLNNSPNALLVRNKDTSVRYVNPALEKLTGFTSEELIGVKAPYPWWPEELVEINTRDLNKAMEEGMLKAEKRFRRKNGETFWVETSSAPVRNVFGFEYYLTNWVDITERKQVIKALQQRETELKIKTKNLEEVNTALQVLLKVRERDRIDLEKKILLNVTRLINPYLEKIMESGLDDKQMTYAMILQTNVNNIISSFVQTLSVTYKNLSPGEVHVSNLIKNGKTTKEISSIMNLSTQTINSYRRNIRKKMGITNQQVNLRTTLSSLEKIE